MSLLDDVSIVVTPNGYKAGTLYGVIPVPTEGAEEVTYPNFTNSDISQWKIASSRATPSWDASEFLRLTYDAASGSALYATFGHTLNVVYKVTMRVRGTKADGTTAQGSAFSSIGDNNELGRAISNPTLTADWQDYEFYTVPTGSTFRFYLSSATIGDLVDFDSISVKEYTAADMDVTRATAATRVDENGLVNYAEIIGAEELTNGDFATDSDWTKGTGWAIGVDKAIYTGTANSNLEQGSILNSGINYILNYEVISSTLSGGIVKLSGETASAQNVLSQVAGTHSLIFTANGSSPEDFKIRIVVNTSGSYEITNISVKEIQRDNVPRIDYTGGGCPHILAEPQRTNLIIYSEDFSQWTTTGATSVSPNDNISPDGTLNASTVSGLTGSGSNDLSIVIGENPASKSYSFSVYLKG